MSTIQEQIAQAKAAGYSDDDIAKHLATRADLAPKIKQATDAGYKPDQIVAHLSAAPAVAKDAPKDEQPGKISSIGAGLGKGFGEVVLGAQGLVGKGLQKLGETVTPDAQTLSGLVTGKKDRGLIQSAGDWLANDAERGRAKLTAELAPYKAANPLTTGAGEIGGNIVATLPVGGILGKGVSAAAPALARAGVSAPTIQSLANAVRTGGFRTGAPAAVGLGAKAADMGLRVAGGAITGGTAAALINPESAATGALVGGALPPALVGAGKLAGYAGRSIYSLAQPFTAAGQERIAGKIINKFAEDGPTALNNAQLVAGSTPTLAEATGNAGIAGLQRNVSEVRPNLFSARQKANGAARAAAFDDVAGDAGKLDYFKSSRADAADDLYGQAAKADIGAAMTPYLKGQITQLLKRPSINDARKTAQRWAIERGEKASFDGNLTGLHDMKLALDDGISEAVRKGKGNEAKALTNTKDKLLDVMEKLSPAYKEARITYGEMSKPINQMEVLQGLNLTNGRGTITLSKVQSAIDGLEKKIAAPGISPAKSLTSDQLGTLKAIRDDLLRQTNLGAGKAAGSNTLQNIATDNVLSTLMPGKVGEVVGGKVGGVVGQIGKLMYSGPNEAIRNRMVDLMLDPVAAQSAMTAARQPILSGQVATSIRDLSNSAAPVVYRSAPALSSSR